MGFKEWLFGEDPQPVAYEGPQPKVGEYKINVNTWARGGDEFGIVALVYKWKSFWEDDRYNWHVEKRWEWSSTTKNLAEDKQAALDYAKRYVENTRLQSKEEYRL